MHSWTIISNKMHNTWSQSMYWNPVHFVGYCTLHLGNEHLGSKKCMEFDQLIIIIYLSWRLPLDSFRRHVSRSVFKGLPWFLLPVGEWYFITLGNLFRGILFTCCMQLLLYSSNLSKTGVILNSFAICFVIHPSVSCYSSHAFHLCCCTSLALIVQVSLPYNKTGRANVLYSFILVFLKAFCGLNTLFKIPVIFKNLFNFLSMSNSLS